MISGSAGSSDVGITGPDKGKGGKYLLLPPGYKGEVPEGYFVVRSRTYGNLLFFRTFLKDGDPKPGVDMREEAHCESIRLPKPHNPPPMKFVDISGKSFNTLAPADYSAFEFVNHVIQARTEPTRWTRTRSASLPSIGIEKGKPFAPDARMKKILTEAAAVGDATARTLAYQSRIKEAFYYPNSAWCTPFVGGSYKFEQNGVRLLDAYSFFFFYATGDHAGDGREDGRGRFAVRWAFVDAKGNPLDGSKTYKVHLPPNIPAKDFWSFIVYDNQTRSMVQTDQQFPSVSSQTQGTHDECRWVGGCLFRPEGSARQRKQLGTDLSRQRLEHPSCVSTALSSRGSTKRGGRARLSWSNTSFDPEPRGPLRKERSARPVEINDKLSHPF